MYSFLKRLLFLFDPEKIHHFTAFLIHWIGEIPLVSGIISHFFTLDRSELEQTVFGLKFKNPVGLAAGFDKNATMYKGLNAFGFGFVEIGTVTPKPQDGNPKKRLFRLPEDEALVNRMGFNNIGVDEVVKHLKKNKNTLIGGNIGKNKITPNEEAINDYKICFEALYEHVDYFAINVSSPNTPNLRQLQEKEPLTNLLNTLQKVNIAKSRPKPILLKIAPDLSHSQLDEIIDIVEQTKIAGVIATNTTISREGLVDANQCQKGGLSGKPLTQNSTDVIRYISKQSNKAFPIIGVGGIHSPQDAIQKIEAGASLVQVYTGFVYEGPLLIKKINKEILRRNIL